MPRRKPPTRGAHIRSRRERLERGTGIACLKGLRNDAAPFLKSHRCLRSLEAAAAASRDGFKSPSATFFLFLAEMLGQL
ncbi:hypothetical protein MRX96_018273 [Rhipicephalus microplus]